MGNNFDLPPLSPMPRLDPLPKLDLPKFDFKKMDADMAPHEP